MDRDMKRAFLTTILGCSVAGCVSTRDLGGDAETGSTSDTQGADDVAPMPTETSTGGDPEPTSSPTDGDTDPGLTDGGPTDDGPTDDGPTDTGVTTGDEPDFQLDECLPLDCPPAEVNCDVDSCAVHRVGAVDCVAQALADSWNGTVVHVRVDDVAKDSDRAEMIALGDGTVLVERGYVDEDSPPENITTSLCTLLPADELLACVGNDADDSCYFGSSSFTESCEPAEPMCPDLGS